MNRIRALRDEPRLRAWVGDALAAVAVLLGAGLLGGLVLFGPILPSPMGFDSTGVQPGPGPAGGPAGPPVPSVVWEAGLGWRTITGALLAAAMLMRRRWPRTVFLSSVVVLCVSLLWGAPALGAGVAATIAAYSLAFRASRRQTLCWVGASAVTVVVLAVASEQWMGLDWRVLQLGSAVVVAAVLGESARSRHEAFLASVERAERAEQGRELEVSRRVTEERLQIARDLHDTVAHRISVINLQAGAAAGFMAKHPEQAQKSLTNIRESARSALQEIGQLLRYLREGTTTSAPPEGDTIGPPHGVADLVPLIRSLELAGLQVREHREGDLADIPEREAAVIYRVVQEGLTNALKHGASSEVLLGLSCVDGTVTISVTNQVAVSEPADANAHDTDTSEPSAGLGLIGVRERVAALQGQVEVSVMGGRHLLRAQFPVPVSPGDGMVAPGPTPTPALNRDLTGNP